MRSHISFFATIFAATLFLSPLLTIQAEDEKFSLTKEEKKLLELTNKERAKENLPPLKPNPQLFIAARKHSANMAKQSKMEHVLDGKTPFDRIKSTGYKYLLAGENIAYANYSIKEVVEGWMDSKPHRKNIMEPKFSEIGLGAVENKEGITYYTQVFGRPMKKR